MANHVHLLVTPLVSPSKLLQSVKGYSAREANKLLERTGPFWQNESYDHWIRDEVEFERVRRYIESNPVRSGLVLSLKTTAGPARTPAESLLHGRAGNR